jgi:hypothetical protein
MRAPASWSRFCPVAILSVSHDTRRGWKSKGHDVVVQPDAVPTRYRMAGTARSRVIPDERRVRYWPCSRGSARAKSSSLADEYGYPLGA